MAYEYIPDPQRTEEYPVTDELAKMVEDLPTNVSIDNVKYFDPFEQDSIILAVRELADVVEASRGRHSASYYRVVVLSELYGFEDMPEEAQEAASRIALGLYRKEHPEHDPRHGNGSAAQLGIVGEEVPKSGLADVGELGSDSHDGGEAARAEDAAEESDGSDSPTGEDAPGQPSSTTSERRKLTVIGCENRGICFSTTEEDGKLTFAGQTFGVGWEVELFSCDVSELSDDGLNEVPFSEASFEWGSIPNMASAFPAWAEDETSFYDEAENAYCHALREMYGFENMMSCDIHNVCGYENMASVKEDEKYEEIFSMLESAYGISLDEEQRERFKNGEKIRAWTPLGEVEIDSEKMMEEIENRKKEANEGEEEMLPSDDPDGEAEVESDD